MGPIIITVIDYLSKVQPGFIYSRYVLVVLCLHKVELLFDAIAALEYGEFERLVGLLRRSLYSWERGLSKWAVKVVRLVTVHWHTDHVYIIIQTNIHRAICC